MKNQFELQATVKEWGFVYGREDFNNLIENIEAGKIHLVVDPIKRKNLKGDSGAVYARRFRGHFMLLLKSNLDEVYSGDANAKFEKHIEPLYAELDSLEQSIMGCGLDYDIDWEAQEIVNVFDENMDGLIVNFTITQTL